MGIKISPSLMCMDMLHVADQIEFLNDKADYLHVDIIDWHYVKNFCLAPFFMDQLKTITDVPMDAHLMVDNTDVDLAQECIRTGAGMVTLPVDIVGRRIFRMINDIRERGAQVGVYLNPGMRLDEISHFIHLVDKITFMTVDPGYAGQKFIRESLDKVEQARTLREKNDYTYEIEIDGSCNMGTFKDLHAAGADVFIVGSSGLFGLDKDLAKAWDIMTDNIYKATGQRVNRENGQA